MAKVQPHFGDWDYVVVVVVLLISSGIGIYYRFTGGKQKTMREYLLADKNMSLTPVAFSLMASFMSSVTLLGLASENYTYGIQFVAINFSYPFGTAAAAHIYAPVFFKLQATSVYEYLEKRFGKVARLAASLMYSLQMSLYMGVVLYTPALALEALTGISQPVAILSVGIVCAFYSSIGGMKAVLITDVFQSLLMFAAVFSVIIAAIVETGSIGEIWKRAVEGNRTEFWNFSPDPTVRHTWFTLVIGGFVVYLSLYGVNQTQVQRYLTVKDLKTAQKAIWLNWPILSLLSITTSFSGLCIYSKYYNCDPFKMGYISRSDQLMPYYVIDTMGQIPGLSGLFVAGLFSAALSSVSAAINSLAAITIEDYYKPIHKKLYKRPLSEKTAQIQTKVASIIFGGVCIAVAFVAQFLGGVLEAAFTIFGVIGGPLLGLFSLGMFTTMANEKGSLIGLVCGLILSMTMGFGKKPPTPKLPSDITCPGIDLFSLNSTILTLNSTMSTLNAASTENKSDYFWLFRVSYMYNGPFGLIATFLVGYIASFIVRKWTGRGVEEEKYDPNLFVSWISKRLKKQKDFKINLNRLQELTNSDENLKSN